MLKKDETCPVRVAQKNLHFYYFIEQNVLSLNHVLNYF